MNSPSIRRLLPALLFLLLLPVAGWSADTPGPVMTACVSEDVDGVRSALAGGADPDETFGTSEMTCLHVAALKGNSALAKLLLDNGANKNAPFKLEGGGSTSAEQIARAKEHTGVADLIRDHRRSSGNSGGTPARRTIDGGTTSGGGGANPVMTACASEDVAGVRSALDGGGDVDEIWGASGMTCLHVSAVKGNRALAQLLLERGANRNLPFKKDDGGSLTAEEIARAKGNAEIADLIRDYTPPRRGTPGGNSGNSGSDGEAGPVMTSCVGENVAGVRSALAGGASPDETFGPSGMTCLHVAALKGNRELAKVLLEGGANKHAPFKKDDGGTLTAEEIARAKSNTDVADFIRDFTPRRGGAANNSGNSGTSGDAGERLRKAAESGDLAGVRSALQAGANVNSRDAEGMTPLMYGVAGGSDEVVSALLGAGANVDAQSDKGYTAAAFAVVGNKPSMVKKILARGGDPNLTISGVPLLIFAALKGFTECGQALINAGADVNFKMSNGNSALSVARDKKFPDFVKMLQRNGATR